MVSSAELPEASGLGDVSEPLASTAWFPPSALSLIGRIGPDEELASGCGFGESCSSLGFFKIGIGATGVCGVLGSARLVAACGGVAGCTSLKSSKRTVFGDCCGVSAGVLELDGTGDLVRSCRVGVCGASGIGTSGMYAGVIGVFNVSVVAGVVDVRRVICGSAGVLEVDIAGAPGGAGGAGGIDGAVGASSSSMVSSCCRFMELMSPSGESDGRTGVLTRGVVIVGAEPEDGFGREGAVGGAGGSCGGSGGLLNGSSGGGSSGGFGLEREANMWNTDVRIRIITFIPRDARDVAPVQSIVYR